jgi:hypothetical protein
VFAEIIFGLLIKHVRHSGICFDTLWFVVFETPVGSIGSKKQ